MKTKTKRLAALLSAVILAVMLCACGASEPVCGKWEFYAISATDDTVMTADQFTAIGESVPTFSAKGRTFTFTATEGLSYTGTWEKLGAEEYASTSFTAGYQFTVEGDAGTFYGFITENGDLILGIGSGDDTVMFDFKSA